MPFTPKELTWLGVAKETTWGTGVNPSYFPPFKDAKPDDVIDAVKDDGIRGAFAQTYNVMQGVSHSTMDVSGMVFPDAFGLFVLAMLGKDTVTGSSAPYTHQFALNRTAQPPSLSYSRYDGTNIRQFTGHVVEELGIKWADKSALEFTTKSQGKTSTVVTGITNTASTAIPFMGWNFSSTLGGTTTVNLVGFDITIKRKLYLQHAANNSQNPSSIIGMAVECTGKMTVDKQDDTELLDFLNNTQPAVVLTGTQGANTSIVIQMSKCAFVKAPVTGKEVVQVDVEFDAIDNATDGGPVTIQLKNAVASY